MKKRSNVAAASKGERGQVQEGERGLEEPHIIRVEFCVLIHISRDIKKGLLEKARRVKELVFRSYECLGVDFDVHHDIKDVCLRVSEP